MKVELINIDELKPFEKNPKQHPKEQIDRIIRSIQEFGFTNPILALKENNMIIAGHARLKAAQQMNMAQVPVIFLDMPYEKAIAYVVADNRLAELASWDEQMLLPLLEDIKLSGLDVELTGFTLQDISLMGKKEVQEDDFDAEKAAAEIKEPITKLGDIWILGRHRLLCGDSTKREDVERLMDGKKADMVFTDPPYGIKIVKNHTVGGGGNLRFGGKKGKFVNVHKFTDMRNDNSIEVARNSYNLCKELNFKNMIFWGGNYFTDFLPPSRCWIIWDKENTGNFTDVEIAWTSFKTGARLYRWLWNGLSRKGQRKTELTSRIHPTQKPVGLLGNILNDLSKENETIIDLFGGSGSTLIACEQLDRICYMMEIDPIYCDVIVQRWEKFTGQKAHKLEEYGQTTS